MIDFKYYASIFLRRFPYFMIVAVLFAAIGISVATVLPQQYRAEALLLVESERISGELVDSTVTISPAEQLEIIQRLIEARGSLLELANRLDIYKDRSALDPSEIVVDLRDRIEIRPQFTKEAATTVRVAFTAGTGQKSAQVVNEVVTMMLQQNAELRGEAAEGTLEFFKQEVASLGDTLDRQSAEILQFKLANGESLPDSLDYNRTRQTALQERLLQLQREEAGLVDRRSRLIDLFERTGRVDLNPENLTTEERQLLTLRADLENALTVLSPTNPRIRILQSKITTLEGVVAAQGGSDSAATEGLSLFEIQVAEFDGQILYVRELTQQVNAELELLKGYITATPGNSIRLSELERDHSNTRAQYDAAVARLATAETGDRIEKSGRGGRITIIEPAVTPTEPYSPNRPLIAAISVAVGLLLGLGVIVLMELMNRSIRRPIEIERKLGITPIATLPYMRTSRELFARRFILILALFICVVGVPLALWAAHTFYLPMDLLVDRALEKTGLAGLIDALSQSDVR